MVFQLSYDQRRLIAKISIGLVIAYTIMPWTKGILDNFWFSRPVLGMFTIANIVAAIALWAWWNAVYYKKW